jgi:hypothetical protein
MNYYEVFIETPYCGTSREIYVASEMSLEQVKAIATIKADENAQQYEYLVFQDTTVEDYAKENDLSYEDAKEEMQAEIDFYYQFCVSYVTQITKEEYEESYEDEREVW